MCIAQYEDLHKSHKEMLKKLNERLKKAQDSNKKAYNEKNDGPKTNQLQMDIR